jgi:hypothetical protein
VVVPTQTDGAVDVLGAAGSLAGAEVIIPSTFGACEVSVALGLCFGCDRLIEPRSIAALMTGT